MLFFAFAGEHRIFSRFSFVLGSSRCRKDRLHSWTIRGQIVDSHRQEEVAAIASSIGNSFSPSSPQCKQVCVLSVAPESLHLNLHLHSYLHLHVRTHMTSPPLIHVYRHGGCLRRSSLLHLCQESDPLFSCCSGAMIRCWELTILLQGFPKNVLPCRKLQ